MNLETKYSIGDKVRYYSHGEIRRGAVDSIRVGVSKVPSDCSALYRIDKYWWIGEKDIWCTTIPEAVKQKQKDRQRNKLLEDIGMLERLIKQNTAQEKAYRSHTRKCKTQLRKKKKELRRLEWKKL